MTVRKFRPPNRLAAMIKDKRLVLRFTATSAAGMVR